MKTIALRFSNNFAPKTGTIVEHQKLIDKNGYVWYGKLGSSISNSVINMFWKTRTPKYYLFIAGLLEGIGHTLIQYRKTFRIFLPYQLITVIKQICLKHGYESSDLKMLLKISFHSVQWYHREQLCHMHQSIA